MELSPGHWSTWSRTTTFTMQAVAATIWAALLLMALHPTAAAAVHCPPGAAGSDCKFTLKSVFHEHAQHVYSLKHVREPDLRGWNVAQETYHKLAEKTNASFIVEVGVWKGASSIVLAKWLKQRKRGVVMSIDTFLGSVQMWGNRKDGVYDPAMDLQWRHGYPSIYYTFLSNVIHENVQDYVIPFPVPSRLAAEFLRARNVKADLIHIDGAHEYDDALEDIRCWWGNVAPGGIMMGDDYDAGAWPGLVAAVTLFAKENELQVDVEGVKWWVHKPVQ